MAPEVWAGLAGIMVAWLESRSPRGHAMETRVALLEYRLTQVETKMENTDQDPPRCKCCGIVHPTDVHCDDATQTGEHAPTEPDDDASRFDRGERRG